MNQNFGAKLDIFYKYDTISQIFLIFFLHAPFTEFVIIKFQKKSKKK